jgi:hypothetical protein
MSNLAIGDLAAIDVGFARHREVFITASVGWQLGYVRPMDRQDLSRRLGWTSKPGIARRMDRQVRRGAAMDRQVVAARRMNEQVWHRAEERQISRGAPMYRQICRRAPMTAKSVSTLELFRWL